MAESPRIIDSTVATIGEFFVGPPVDWRLGARVLWADQVGVDEAGRTTLRFVWGWLSGAEGGGESSYVEVVA